MSVFQIKIHMRMGGFQIKIAYSVQHKQTLYELNIRTIYSILLKHEILHFYQSYLYLLFC